MTALNPIDPAQVRAALAPARVSWQRTKTGKPVGKVWSLDAAGKPHKENVKRPVDGCEIVETTVATLADLVADAERLGAAAHRYSGTFAEGMAGKVLRAKGLGTPCASLEYLAHRAGPAVLCLDADDAAEHFGWKTHVEVAEGLRAAVPWLRGVELLVLDSSGSCIALDCAETKGPGGFHVYAVVEDGTQIAALLEDAHQRCIGKGLGWIKIGVSGVLYDRSPVDQQLRPATQPDFMWPHMADKRLTRSRKPWSLFPGGRVPTLVELLSPDEIAAVGKLIATMRKTKGPEALAVREAYLLARGKASHARHGGKIEDHVATVRRACETQRLGPGFDVPLGNGKTCTVAELVADPKLAGKGWSLPDPIDPDYGPGKAQLTCDNGRWSIVSMAHGKVQRYTLGLVEVVPEGPKGEDPPPRGGEAGGASGEPDAPLVLADVLAELDAAHAVGKLTHDGWCALLVRARLGPVDERAALNHIAEDLFRVGRIAARAQLAEYREKLAAVVSDGGLAKAAHGRRLLAWEGTDLNVMARAVEDDLIAAETVYQVDNAFVSVREAVVPGTVNVEDATLPPPEQVLIVPIDPYMMLLAIDKQILFTSHNKKEDRAVPMEIPPRLPSIMLALPDKRVPEIVGLVTHPIVLPDGRVLASDGIDRATGLYLALSDWPFGIGPEHPTQADAVAAAARLRELLLADVLLRDRAADGSAFIGALLLGVARKALPKAPQVLINAATQGTGKTSLAQAIHVVLTGKDMPVSRMAPDAGEFKKALFALLIASPAMSCFDNIKDGETLCDENIGALASVLTSRVFEDRILGVTKVVNARTNVLFVFTGNNIGVGTDFARRTLQIDLLAKDADPERRVFTHPDLVGYVRSVRAEVLACVLTIQRAWFAAGCPVLGASLGFGPELDRLVTWPLAYCGEGSLSAKFDQVKAASPEGEAKLELLRALKGWQDKHGDEEGEWLPGQMARDLAKATEADTERAALLDALGQPYRLTGAVLGKALRPLIDNPLREGLVLRCRFLHGSYIYSVRRG